MTRGGKRKHPFIGPLTYEATVKREQAAARGAEQAALREKKAERQHNREAAMARRIDSAERKQEVTLTQLHRDAGWTLPLRRLPCSRCGYRVQRSALIQPPETVLGLNLLCEPCWNHLAVTFLPQQERSMRLDSYYRRQYGIGFQEYGDLYLRQLGKCAICDEMPEKPLVIDHDHATGAVRGLLCATCNSGLGMFKDNVGALAGAIGYLSRAAQLVATPSEVENAAS